MQYLKNEGILFNNIFQVAETPLLGNIFLALILMRFSFKIPA